MKHHAGNIGKITTYRNPTGEARFHVVNLRPTGFIVIAGDDALEPVIAFSTQGTFAGFPGNPLYTMLMHDTEVGIKSAKANRAVRGASVRERLITQNKWKSLTTHEQATPQTVPTTPLTAVTDVCVQPLLQLGDGRGIQWNQEDVMLGSGSTVHLYNYFTPQNYCCGCVATALAQIMRFWQYPTAGVGTALTGTVSVLLATSTTPIIVTRNLLGGNKAGGPYDWADMVPSPGASINSTQIQAIGALTSDAGVAMNMEYAQDGSGAIISAKKLKTFFQYGSAALCLPQDASFSQILTAITANLDAGQPVELGINGAEGGHSIVCDGYGYEIIGSTSTLYHHLNMGWGGTDNLWYNLPTVNPIDQSQDHYTIVDDCTYNINPGILGEIIAGRILSSGGAPVPGVAVTLSSSSFATVTATTNAEGIYFFRGIPSVSSSITSVVTPSAGAYSFSPFLAVTTTGSSGTYTPVGDAVENFVATPDAANLAAQSNAASTFTVTPGSDAHSTITPSSAQTVTSGSSITFTATPAAGYAVYQWYINGQLAETGTNTFTVNDVTANDTVSVTSTTAPYAPTMQSPFPGSTLTSGTVTFEWNAGSGNTNYSLSVGASQGADDIYESGDLGDSGDEMFNLTVNNIPTDGANIWVRLWADNPVNGWVYTDYTYTAAYAPQNFTITPTAGSGGAISPSSAQTVSDGASMTFTATPASGYQVSGWLINGTPAGFPPEEAGPNTYTISNVTSSDAIEVTFAPIATAAAILAPTSGATITSSTAAFTWSAGAAATGYELTIGSTYGDNDIFDSAELEPGVLSVTGTVPLEGETLYVTLWTDAGGDPLYNEYTYTAAAPVETCTVTPSAGNDGSISPDSPQTIASGSSCSFTASPDSGYAVNQWLVNGSVAQTGGASFTTSDVTANESVNVTFTPVSNTCTVTPSAGTGGGISPNSVQSVVSGGSCSFTATPDTGYVVNQWLVNGSLSQTGGASFTLSDITANATVEVTFYQTTVAQMLSPTPGSSLSSSAVTFQWNAPSDAQAYGLYVGASVGAHNIYDSAVLSSTSLNVTGLPTNGETLYVRLYTEIGGSFTYYNDYTYTASGATVTTYTVTPSAGTGGAISPNTSQTVASGSNAMFTATPNTGYMVNQWLVNGSGVQTGGASFTVSNVTANTTIQVTFSPVSVTYTVTPGAGPGGSISPNTVQTVASGSSAAFTATPDTGYSVGQWLVNGTVVQTGGTGFTLGDVAGNTTVEVTFTQNSGAPTVITEPAASSGSGAETLNASINPNGTAAAGFFQYGADTNYGSATASVALGSGTISVTLAQTVSGLQQGVTYHCRAAAVTTSGTTYGTDQTFTPDFSISSFAGKYEMAIAGSDFATSGLMEINITRKGAFTVSLALGGRKTSFSGKVAADGAASANHSGYSIQMNLAEPYGEKTVDVILSGPLQLSLTAELVTTGSVSPATYTVRIPHPSDSTLPQGDGYGAMSVSKTGSIHLAGRLGDGTPFSASAGLLANGTWALYVPLYRNQGCIVGTITFETTSKGDMDGPVIWIKPATTGNYNTGAFATQANLYGSAYTKPLKDQSALPITTGSLELQAGNLDNSPLFNDITLTTTNKFIIPSLTLDKLTITLSASTGLFNGSFKETASSKAIKFSGAIFQGGLNFGAGVFEGDTEPGSVLLFPPSN